MISCTDEALILERRAELDVALDAFCAWWRGCVVRAEVYVFPIPEEGVPVDRVPVTVERGEAAFDRAERIYRQVRRIEGQGAAVVARLPGLLVVGTDDLTPARLLNASKEALRRAIRESEPDERARLRLCHRLFPGQLMNQIYRAVPLVEGSFERLTFGWAPRSTSSRTLSHAAVHELLDRAEAGVRASAKNEMQQAIAIARERLHAAHPTHTVRQVRPLAAHPRLTVHESVGAGGSKRTLYANVPALARADDLGQASVRALPTFDSSLRRKRRSDTSRRTELLRSLHLFFD